MTKNKSKESFLRNPHIAAGLVKPFIAGARLQIKRLLEAQHLLKHDPINGVYECYHESSNLFEDLATAVQYLRLCGINSPQDQTFLDLRDHIRHDIREEFDLDKKRKNERAKRLGLNPKLQAEISFDIGTVKVGSTVVKLSDIASYLNNAETIINALMLGVKPENLAPAPTKETGK